LVQQDNVMTCI